MIYKIFILQINNILNNVKILLDKATEYKYNNKQ